MKSATTWRHEGRAPFSHDGEGALWFQGITFGGWDAAVEGAVVAWRKPFLNEMGVVSVGGPNVKL